MLPKGLMNFFQNIAGNILRIAAPSSTSSSSPVARQENSRIQTFVEYVKAEMRKEKRRESCQNTAWFDYQAAKKALREQDIDPYDVDDLTNNLAKSGVVAYIGALDKLHRRFSRARSHRLCD